MAEKKAMKIDMVAGSRSYNRLDMQVSQTLHMAIDLYDQLNFLLILDHYDDITLFDLDKDPLAVSYYQVKTSGDMITIDSAISEGWFAKLFAQLRRPEGWLVNELGLITNTPFEIKFTERNQKGKKTTRTNNLIADRRMKKLIALLLTLALLMGLAVVPASAESKGSRSGSATTDLRR